MSIDEITEFVESLGGVLTLAPEPGDGTPELAWGDRFFYYSPDGALPPGQPFATIVTKDYPDEPAVGLGAGVFRVNVDAGLRGQAPVAEPARRDVVQPHPAYGGIGWIAVVAPGERTAEELPRLLREAHAAAKRRWERRRS